MSQDIRSRDTDYPPFIQYLLAYAIYTPIFAIINAAGFLVIYMVGTTGLFEPAPPQFFGIIVSSLLLALSLVPSQFLIRRGNLPLGQALLAGGASVFIALSNLFWGGLTNFLFFVVWFPGLLQLIKAENRRQWIPPIIASLAGTVVLIMTEAWAPANRMVFNQGASLLGFWFFVFTMTALITLVLILHVIPFRTLSGRLLVSFLAIVVIPILIITLVTGLQTFQQEQVRTLSQLDTIGELKTTQIKQLIEPIAQDLMLALQNSRQQSRVVYILKEPTTARNYDTLYQQSLDDFNTFLSDSGKYQEVFLADINGNVILSTNDSSVGTNVAGGRFFEQGISTPAMSVVENRFSDIGTFGIVSIVAAYPIVDTETNQVVGIAGLRSSFDPVAEIMSVYYGIGETDESYLVDTFYRRLTPTLSSQTDLRTFATEQAIEKQLSGSGTYANTNGVQMNGAYRWIPELDVAIVTEMEAIESITGSISIIISNILLGLFTVAIAAVSIFLTARSISLPIMDLSADVQMVSQGNLQSRSHIKRADEIGTLAISFNQMAEELQSIVSGLETRVIQRTSDLERQTQRLRAASEVARDAASARNLNDLLERSAMLIMERFRFYHTGIFLLDSKREYAVLRSSPTAAGKEMLAREHKLRIGEEGIVGYVAATGDPRIALDTGADATHFLNPSLPNTRSEIALPLKANNVVIGVLDMQSDQPEAFNQQDIAILQIMADQLAAAIDRTRLLQEVEQNLSRMEQAYQQFTETSWQSFTSQRVEIPGYSFQGTALTPIAECPPDARDALMKGRVVLLERHTAPNELPYSILAVPVKLRGQTIGVLNLKIESDNISSELVSTIEEAAIRFGIALENSRLIAETQVRADRERAIAEITGRIGATVETDEIMRTTVEEIGKMLGNAKVTFRLKNPADGKRS